MLLMEFDKAGAEWVVVAYLTGDARMIDIVESGKSPHVVTGHLITRVPEELLIKEDKLVGKLTDPDALFEKRMEFVPEILALDGIFLPRSMTCRQCGKKSNHSLNYGETYRTFALLNEIEEREAKTICDLYVQVYTGVPLWWNSIKRQLRKDRTLISLLGRKVELVDEWGNDLFKSAYSFNPQSTVGDMVCDALIELEEDYSPAMLKADPLTQTHDSATVQYPTDDWYDMAEFAIKFGLEYMSPELEANGRKFKIGTDLKVGLSWGSMLEVKLTDDKERVAHELEAAWHKLAA